MNSLIHFMCDHAVWFALPVGVLMGAVSLVGVAFVTFLLERIAAFLDSITSDTIKEIGFVCVIVLIAACMLFILGGVGFIQIKEMCKRF